MLRLSDDESVVVFEDGMVWRLEANRLELMSASGTNIYYFRLKIRPDRTHLPHRDQQSASNRGKQSSVFRLGTEAWNYYSISSG